MPLDQGRLVAKLASLLVYRPCIIHESGEEAKGADGKQNNRTERGYQLNYESFKVRMLRMPLFRSAFQTLAIPTIYWYTTRPRTTVEEVTSLAVYKRWTVK